MDLILLIVGLVCLAGAITVAVLLTAGGLGERAPKASISAVNDFYGSEVRSVRPGDMAREIDPLMVRLGRLATRLSAKGYAAKMQRRLDLAGNPSAWPAQRVLSFKGMLLIVGIVVAFLLSKGTGPAVIVWTSLGGVVGFFLPDILLKNTGEKRQAEILKGLPDALDMMTVCVEAGLGFDAALAQVARNLEGPAAGEFARMLQEMQVGKSRTEALKSLADRTDVSELRVFVTALVQASELGISIGNVLREQAKEMRIRRRQRAEEKAHKLPVKILAPLIVCLLPGMFVVILGPAVLQISDVFGSR